MNSIITPQWKARSEAYAAIRREVSSRYADERKTASAWRRLALWFKIEHEVRKEMKRRFPPQALYTTRLV
ncbi:MAG: hypothetical protein WC378_16110 [Opitutaceae bacterium]|jgi:hypothetical protein